MTTLAAPVRRRWLALLSAVIVFAILIALGTWQMQRLAWKEQLLATTHDRLAADPVDLTVVLASGTSMADQEYRRVRLSGRFVHSAERHFFATFNGASGFYVYTPLQLADGDHVFVNRGFVAYDKKDPATRTAGQVEGIVSVVGLVRTILAEKPSAVVPDNDPAKNVFYWKDIRAMAESAGLPADADVLGLFIDADATPNPGGMPVGGVTMIDLPNNHLQYAFTWYGLAAALAVVVALQFRRPAVVPNDSCP